MAKKDQDFMVEDDLHLDLSSKDVKPAAKPSTADGAAEARLPLFYHQPAPLDKQRHAKAGISGKATYAFARETVTVPLNVGEFALASKHYPIVFTTEAQPMPMAVLGLNKHNLFVDAKGGWRQYHYIPGYIRRYPFIFTVIQDSKLVLCVDEQSQHFAESAPEQPFFDEKGEATTMVQQALQFCEEFQKDNARTRALTSLLAEKNLLIERQVTYDLMGEERHLAGFKVIDEQALTKLDDQTLLQLTKSGALALIYHHLQSLSNFPVLVQMLADA